jgi:hypothetical protein
MMRIFARPLWALMLAGLLSVSWAQATDADLLAHWSFDGSLEASGALAVKATPAVAPVFQEGVVKQAVQFDGKQQLVTLKPAKPLLTGASDSLTITYWLRNEAFPVPEGKSLLSQASLYAGADKNSGFTARWQWKGTDESGRLAPGQARASFWYWTAGDTKGKGTVGPLCNAKAWNQIAIVVDQAVAKCISFYVNGSLVKAMPLMAAMNPVEEITLGAQANKQRLTQGMMDDLRLYGRALSADEIQKLFASASSGGAKIGAAGGEAAPSVTVSAEAPDERLAYNQPGLVTDLSVGLWAIPLPVDYDGDGDLDMLISTANAVSGGLYFAENDGSGVFKAPRRISTNKNGNYDISYVDGKPILTEPETMYPDFRKTQLERPQPIGYKQDFFAGRENQWRFADYDGDGAVDLIVGVSDWREYGWDDAYNDKGEWTAGPLHGNVYWAKNTGTTEKPVYAKAVKIEAAGKPLDVYGAPSPCLVDWDGDGDLDIICGSFLDTLTLFINEGTRTAPKYAAGQFMKVKGETLHMELEMLRVTVIDWDKDGDPDIIVGEEDGRVSLIENAGKGADGLPEIKAPKYFRQQAGLVKIGVLPPGVAYDWDGDGDQDLVLGDTAGFINVLENMDGKCPPRLAPPKRLSAGGQVFRVMAEKNLSIQGPAEAKWGYPALDVADWDGDGLPDIITNDIIGKVRVLRNVGTRSAPKLAAPEPVQVEWTGPAPKPAWLWWKPEAKDLVIEWRTKPTVLDFNGDGLVDLAAIDHEGFLALYERKKVDGKLVLLPGKRIFKMENDGSMYGANSDPLKIDLNKDGFNDLLQRAADGSLLYFYTRPGTKISCLRNVKGIVEADGIGKDAPNPETSRLLRPNAGWAGRSGRRKMTFVDWDKDGKLDLLVNSVNITFLKNVGEKGEYVFKDMGPILERKLAGHDTCAVPVDWDRDGIDDLIVTVEDGHLYYYPRKAATELLGRK